MKCLTIKILSFGLVSFWLFFCGLPLAFAYSFENLKDDFVSDTKETFLKDLNTNANWDFLEKDFSKRLKFSLSTGLVAWKFIAVEVIGLYTPNSANSVAEGGLSFPIRLGEIPVGRGTKLTDYNYMFDKFGNLSIKNLKPKKKK